MRLVVSCKEKPRQIQSFLHVEPFLRVPLLFPKELVPFVILTDYLSERSVVLLEYRCANVERRTHTGIVSAWAEGLD